MCKAKRKLEAFYYILTKFVARQKKITSASSDESKFREQIIDSFSNKRLMKLLYLLCLESIPSDFTGIGLFDIFDNMIAYPNGPVEQDVYDGLELIPDVQYNEGKFINLPAVFNGSLETRCREMIDVAFEKLTQHINEEQFANTNYLIDIVHNLYLWPKTYVSSSESKLIQVRDIEELIKEKSIYDKIVLA